MNKKIAIPMENGVLCAHFGHCEYFAIITVANGQIVDSKELSFDEYKEWKINRGSSKEELIEKPYKRIYAWVLENPVKFKEPIVYKHPMGAVIWVNLNDYDI